MKRISLFTFCSLMMLYSCEKPANHYPANQSPLFHTKFIKLPLGAVKPNGWLLDQLQAQASGLTGHLDEFWNDIKHSAWKGEDGESWERGPYYLDGLLPLAYLLGDEHLVAKTKPFIEWILQSGQPDGWFGPEKNGDRWPNAVALKVLQQYYEASGDERALDTIKGWFRYLHDNPADWPDDTWRGVRAMEHAVTGYWLYCCTGDPDVLETIESIFENSFNWVDYYHNFPWDSTAFQDGRMPLDWKAVGLTAHVVNNAMAIKYPGIYYQQSLDDRHKEAVYKGLDNYDLHHGQIGGRFAGDEHLSGKAPTQGTEMCAVVELMFSLEYLVEIFGDAALADRLELLAYNALPGTMTPDCWAHQYDQQSNQVLVSDAERDWSTNGNTSNVFGLMPNYPCCLANMHQGWPKFIQHMWMATHDNGVAAIAYGPCDMNAKVSKDVDLKIIEETEYPFDGAITFKINVSKSATFPVYLRKPQWADKISVFVNGKEFSAKLKDGFIFLNRKWQSGDVVKLDIPLEIKTERRYNNSIAIKRGPLYFSLRIGKDYQKIHLSGRSITSIDYMGTTDWQIKPTTPWNYGLLMDESNPAESFNIRKNPIQKYPFSDKGELVYDETMDQYFSWNYEAPIVLTVKGKRIPKWGLKNNSADVVPQSPASSNGPEEEIELVPYACARLRISEFPVIK